MTRITEFKMIVALCRGGGIGYEGQLPWPKLARDMRFFAEMTSSSVFPYNSAVVMGRRTWDSIPASVRPLKFRENFVISALHTDEAAAVDTAPTGVTFLKNLSEIHEHAKNYDVVWFIGGASIYEQVLSSPSPFPSFNINEIYITFVDETYEHDTAFPLMYQYESIEEWEALRNNPMNRAIWCWTDAESVPPYVSFFNDRSPATNVLYQVEDVDRDIVSSITRTTDIRGIQERRLPDTRFLRAFRRTARSRPADNQRVSPRTTNPSRNNQRHQAQ
jgi:dihydrofolate reductase